MTIPKQMIMPPPCAFVPHESFVFELTGAKTKIDAFVQLMRPLGLKEVSRTGIAAIARGPEAM